MSDNSDLRARKPKLLTKSPTSYSEQMRKRQDEGVPHPSTNGPSISPFGLSAQRKTVLKRPTIPVKLTRTTELRLASGKRQDQDESYRPNGNEPHLRLNPSDIHSKGDQGHPHQKEKEESYQEREQTRSIRDTHHGDPEVEILFTNPQGRFRDASETGIVKKQPKLDDLNLAMHEDKTDGVEYQYFTLSEDDIDAQDDAERQTWDEKVKKLSCLYNLAPTESFSEEHQKPKDLKGMSVITNEKQMKRLDLPTKVCSCQDATKEGSIENTTTGRYLKAPRFLPLTKVTEKRQDSMEKSYYLGRFEIHNSTDKIFAYQMTCSKSAQRYYVYPPEVCIPPNESISVTVKVKQNNWTTALASKDRLFLRGQSVDGWMENEEVDAFMRKLRFMEEKPEVRITIRPFVPIPTDKKTVLESEERIKLSRDLYGINQSFIEAQNIMKNLARDFGATERFWTRLWCFIIAVTLVSGFSYCILPFWAMNSTSEMMRVGSGDFFGLLKMGYTQVEESFKTGLRAFTESWSSFPWII